MSDKEDILEKLDYEEPRLLELELRGFVCGAGTSPLDGQDPDAEEGFDGSDEEG